MTVSCSSITKGGGKLVFVRTAVLLTGLIGAVGVKAQTIYDTAPTNAGSAMIVGSGITNQHFAVSRVSGVEVALQSHVVCPSFSNATNNGGTGVYTHPAATPCNLFGLGNLRVPWQIDWSINVDHTGLSGLKLSDLRYELLVDNDPGVGLNFVSLGDPVNDPVSAGAFLDHSFGFNTTTSADDFKAGDATTYANHVETFNLVQQSWNYGFLAPTCPPNPSLPQCAGPDLTGPGSFHVKLSAYLTKEACKNGGWQTLTDANGEPFKNQGACVSYASSAQSKSTPISSVTIQVIQQ